MKTTKFTKLPKTKMSSIELEPYLKKWILKMADEQNLTVDVLIETSISNYIEENKIIADELMSKYLSLPKSIRKIIAYHFCVDNEDDMQTEESYFLDSDLNQLPNFMAGKPSFKFSSDVERLFINFLKIHDVFNAEV